MITQTDFAEIPVNSTGVAVVKTTFRPDIVRYQQRKKVQIARNQGENSTSIDAESVSPNADEPSPESVGISRLHVSPSRNHFAPREITLQEWEGRVLEVEGRFISARLVDITANEREEKEEVQLPIDDVIEADQKLLQPGAIFRWVLGYSYARGRKERFARIVVRRLPVWTEQEMREADKEANELHDAIFGDSKNRTASAG
jgi:hypothetical protein